MDILIVFAVGTFVGFLTIVVRVAIVWIANMVFKDDE